jgi:Fe-S cluster assembly iron-binding protein IscA
MIKISDGARTALVEMLSREDMKGKVVRVLINDYT